jgi:hypothetical protein
LMPRAGWVKPESDRRLSDVVSVGLLATVFPPEVVDAAVADCGRVEQRRRALSARSVTYFAMAMPLHSDGSYEDVLALLTDGLAWALGVEAPARLATKAAISHARDRLGSAPLALLFERVARPLARPETTGSWLAGRRLVAIDETCLHVADTPANDAFFGRPGQMTGERAAFPQARVMALAECGTHVMFEAVIGPSRGSEAKLARSLIARLGPGMLCIADRRFYSLNTWQHAAASGADLLWQVKENLRLDAVAVLADGSWLAEVFHSHPDRKRRRPITVRVIDSTVDDGRPQVGPYRLITTIGNPDVASALELAAAYTQRWEIDSALDELETQRRGPRTVLRSKKPDLVLQEIWGHLCCHYAIRALIVRRRRPRPRPAVVPRRAADPPVLHRPTGRLSPLKPSTRFSASGATPSASRPADSCPRRRARANSCVMRRTCTHRTRRMLTRPPLPTTGRAAPTKRLFRLIER